MPFAAARTRVLPRIACHTTGATLLSAPRERPDWSRVASDVDRQMVAIIGIPSAQRNKPRDFVQILFAHPKSANYWYF